MSEFIAAPTQLKTELLTNPAGIASDVPAFSWVLSAHLPGECQSAYRLVISDSLDGINAQEYIFDTGKVFSSQSVCVRPEGLRGLLKENSIYYWLVRLWNKDGVPVALPQPSYFITAVGNEWPSRDFIWCEERSDFAFLRGEFTYYSKYRLDKAILSAAALSPETSRGYVSRVYMNGELAGFTPTRLGRTQDGEESCYYSSFDVTSLLREGNNALGAVCHSANAEKGFLCLLTVFFTNGLKKIFLNCGDDAQMWRALDGTAAFGNKKKVSVGTGHCYVPCENINARVYPFGWSEADFTGGISWGKAHLSPDIPNRPLLPYPGQNMRCFQVGVKNILKLGKKRYLADLGREIIGGLRLTVDLQKIAAVTLKYGEELERGQVKYQMRTGNRYCEKWLLKKGSQCVEGMGFKAFRYVEIDGCPVQLCEDNICGTAQRLPFCESGSHFKCSDSVFNDIYELTKYTVKATNQELYVDSQSRERLAYEGDALINMLSSYSFESEYALARFTNEYLLTHATWPAEYKLFSVIMTYIDYMYTGDITSVERNYELLRQKLFENMLSSETHLFASPMLAREDGDKVLVDWPQTERDGYHIDEAYYNTVFNSVAYGAWSSMSALAAALGKQSDSDYYAQTAESVRLSMLERLFDAQSGSFFDGLNSSGEPIRHYSQHASAFPAAFGICKNGEQASKLAARLCADGEIRMSVYGAFFLLEGLFNLNCGEYAVHRLTDPDTSSDARSWSHMMYTLGATITSEAWSTVTKPNMTFSHPWGSAPASAIVRGIFGIRPTLPGFERFEIKLQPGTLTSAEITVPTVRGAVSVSFEKCGDGVNVQISVPANSSCTAYIPGIGSAALSINGKVKHCESTDGFLSAELRSGVYEIKRLEEVEV